MMKFRLVAILFMSFLLPFSCKQKTPEPQPDNDSAAWQTLPETQTLAEGVHKVEVQEVIQARAYTYLNVKEQDNTYWIAVSKRATQTGETLYFDNPMVMHNFKSRDLDRTFDTIYFIDKIAADPSGLTREEPTAFNPHQSQPEPEPQTISVEPAPGGVTIGQLFENRNDYADQTVKVRGQVVKVSRAIMGRNWVHLRDGTGSPAANDLTVTTRDDANPGDIATFEGKITLDKDFGAGYRYEVIMEDAQKITE